ncbi:hypothetical protein [Bifidobacterium catenulatum]|uniref:hypothetical protein n=1 Tax=Bifidobacterium TaxID=1678 RepID=UPI0012AB37B8|nr:hypothetical protein [Bifidobacterium catenulatum]
MMDIANTLKGLLPKIGFTWDTLLRLFYSLCGWLVIGTLIPVAGASGRTPVGTLRRLLDWLDMPSAFTLGMERWCDGHSMLLAAVGLGVMLFSIVLSCMVFYPDDRVFGMEIPPFCLGLLLYLQAGFGSSAAGWIVVAWVAVPIVYQVRLDMQIWESHHRLANLYEKFFMDLAFTWPEAMLITLLYPLLMLVRLLFGGVAPNAG